MKLTFTDKWMLFWGYQYILNKRSNEVHNLLNRHVSCGIDRMSKKNKVYLSHRKAHALLRDGDADGCRWCMAKFNHG